MAVMAITRKEQIMDKSIANASTIEVQDDDIIVLGVASVETQGGPRAGEMVGGTQSPGISED